MFDTLLSLIAPHVCLQCGIEGSLWCSDCSSSAPPVAERCYKCHQLSGGGRTCKTCRRKSLLFSVQAATRYEGCAKELVWGLKFERAKAAAGPIAHVMAGRVLVPDKVILTHVPAATNHVRRRGYDQAELIRIRLSKLTHTPSRPLLLRLGQQQQRNASRQQRLRQLAGAFRVTRPGLIAGAHIILIDDVVTTGATLEAAGRALKAAGARRVSAIVFAQA